MKLNYKRTLLVGLAFLSICAFWQLYDNVVPLILKNTFDIPDDIAGVIMALDNVLALFLLPLFGKLSDRTHTRLGRRMPYILGGTLAAVVLMNLLPVADAARSLWLFVVALGLLLLAMGVYRSPAVALMPDVTPKPLRSKGNAIINLMGTLGGVFTLAATGLLVTRDATGRENYSALFLAVSILMLAAVVVLLLTIRENRLAREVELQNLATQGEDAAQAQADETPSTGAGFSSLDPALRRSLILILCSVSLWFMGYNAVTTSFTKYAQEMWHMSLGSASMCLTVATAGAIISYIPIGALASRIGRKRTIQGGVLLLSACFAGGFVYTLVSDRFSPLLYVLFALVGLAWAAINVNSLPMVVEMCRGSDIGKFTGYYYTFSMAAQTVTPILSGALLEHVGYKTLFPYAAVFVALSFFTMSLVKHGDNRPTPVKGIEAFEDMD